MLQNCLIAGKEKSYALFWTPVLALNLETDPQSWLAGQFLWFFRPLPHLHHLTSPHGFSLTHAEYRGAKEFVRDLGCNPKLCWSRQTGSSTLYALQLWGRLEPPQGKGTFVPLPWGRR